MRMAELEVLKYGVHMYLILMSVEFPEYHHYTPPISTKFANSVLIVKQPLIFANAVRSILANSSSIPEKQSLFES
jgi:hypothetical protein